MLSAVNAPQFNFAEHKLAQIDNASVPKPFAPKASSSATVAPSPPDAQANVCVSAESYAPTPSTPYDIVKAAPLPAASVHAPVYGPKPSESPLTSV